MVTLLISNSTYYLLLLVQFRLYLVGTIQKTFSREIQRGTVSVYNYAAYFHLWSLLDKKQVLIWCLSTFCLWQRNGFVNFKKEACVSFKWI